MPLRCETKSLRYPFEKPVGDNLAAADGIDRLRLPRPHAEAQTAAVVAAFQGHEMIREPLPLRDVRHTEARQSRHRLGRKEAGGRVPLAPGGTIDQRQDRKSTRLNSSHSQIS